MVGTGPIGIVAVASLVSSSCSDLNAGQRLHIAYTVRSALLSGKCMRAIVGVGRQELSAASPWLVMVTVTVSFRCWWWWWAGGVGWHPLLQLQSKAAVRTRENSMVSLHKLICLR